MLGLCTCILELVTTLQMSYSLNIQYILHELINSFPYVMDSQKYYSGVYSIKVHYTFICEIINVHSIYCHYKKVNICINISIKHGVDEIH